MRYKDKDTDTVYRSPTKNGIQRMMPRDNKILQQLACSGIADRQQLHEYTGIYNDRLQLMINSDLIKIQQKIVSGQMRDIVSLTENGKEYCRQEYGTEKFPKWSTGHLSHDLKMTDLYYQMVERVSSMGNWRHEDLVREDIRALTNVKQLTCVDATIEMSRFEFEQLIYEENTDCSIIDLSAINSCSGETIRVALEAVGNSYSDEMLGLKQDVAIAANCQAIILVR